MIMTAVDTVILAQGQPDTAVTPAFVQWVDQHQWPLCGLIFLACLIIFVVTARQVRREQEQNKAQGRKS
jgi:hypothetical protein